MSDTLTCDRCGLVMEVELENDDDGSTVTAEEYRAALDMLGYKVFCEECQASDEVKTKYRAKADSPGCLSGCLFA